ncbi:hypothetical protein COCHEDRAFT_1162429 [Bipolaris maydis C5]|uniref:CCZ1/INTU/HSP4 first Longin domain-containing protein n=1 Tax=Cochliobolus heterostrophus (strain C5 / ATCC 48332 / race O) TaxID=701091 RepID=M2USL3_COCH5|nr:hypothetical protein COCHEDRAFT_1162429 [Bipolaris maydis C5]
MSSTAVPKVIPAQLSFLAIYNPSLGTSDETFDQQIVFYYSKAAKTRAKLRNGDAQQEQDLRDQENEKLRQVGLAQGMVGFAKSFSNGEPVDTVETEKSRIVLHELENGWWILASIDLTQLPAASGLTRKDSSTDTTEPVIEYSSREVSPPALLIRQLVRAQLIFQLHHGLTLEGMFAKHGRTKFCSILDKYWSRFASNWDVLLHGSPAVDIFGGMKLAAGGELGMGVGEEEWGSSERDVLEDFARRTPGLVDVMVSRFGEVSPLQQAKTSTDPRTLDDSELDPWVGVGRTAQAADGVVFSGLGAVSRKSLRDLSHWVESIYCYGEYAYGVRDNPASDRKKRRRRNPRAALESEQPTPESLRPTRPERPRLATSNQNSALPLGIPPPIKPEQNSPAPESRSMLASLGDTETWTRYMTLGYGTAWGGKKTTDSPQPATPVPEVAPNNGYFLVGLKGDLQDLDIDDENDEGNWNNRIPLRTIHVEVDSRDVSSSSPDVESDETPPYERIMNIPPPTTSKLSRLRPVVYIHRPFIYVFLFEHRTHSLGVASFYRDIHNFFSPLHRSLDKSTNPINVAQRLQAVSSHYTTEASTGGSGPTAGPNTQPIYDLVFDPRTLTVHSSLPNIPDPGTLLAEGLAERQAGWSRLDALNVHSQMLATVASTRRSLSEIERTCKTSRGWVSNRILKVTAHDQSKGRECQRQQKGRRLRRSILRICAKRFLCGAQEMRIQGRSMDIRGLAEGIGIDARRYVEDLLSLNR